MKKKHLLLNALFLLSVLLVSCSDDKTRPLRLYNDYCEVPVGGERYIGAESGNGEYTIEIADPYILTAKMEYGWSDNYNGITIKGLLTGETVVTIIDNATKEKQSVRVRITDNYEHFYVSKNKKESNHPAFGKTYSIYLINNTSRDLYFLSRETIGLTDFQMALQQKGSYEFTKEDDQYYLILTYVSDDKGRLSDIAIPPTPHKFLITEISDYSIHRLDTNLNLGLDTPPIANRDKRIYYDAHRIMLEEVGEGYTVCFSLSSRQIPEGILEF